jgi:hypothetical protein
MMTVKGKLIKVNTTVKSAILQRTEIHEPTTLPQVRRHTEKTRVGSLEPARLRYGISALGSLCTRRPDEQDGNEGEQRGVT